MTRTDHIIALVLTTLQANECYFPAAIEKLNSIYEINEPRKINAVSLGVKEDDLELSLATWINKLRSEKLSRVNCVNYSPVSDRLPAHVAASFAGTVSIIIEIITEKSKGSYIVRSIYSPRYQITPLDFVGLVNAQQDPSLSWSRVSQLILESNRLNNKTIFDGQATTGYLFKDEGSQVFEYLVDSLLKEVQIELLVNKHDFIIPADLQKLFVKYDRQNYFSSDKQYFYLYTTQDVNYDQLVEIITAQGFGDRLWAALNNELSLYNDEEFPAQSPEAWQQSLRTLDQEKLNRIANRICRAICVLCEEDGRKPVIPAAVADYYGPDDIDQQRAGFRSRVDDTGWHLKGLTQPWEYNLFQKISDEVSPVKRAAVEPEARTAFTRSLHDIYHFAVRVESTFREAFGVSLFILGELDYPLPDLQNLPATVESLKTAGFSDRAIGNFEAATVIVAVFGSIGWHDDALRSLLAINISNVFGGMGSWNDQYFEKDQAEYDQITAAFYEAFREYFITIITSTKDHPG